MLLIGFSGSDAMILLSLGPELVQIFRYPCKNLLQRLLLVGGNVAPKQTMKPIRGASQFGQQIVTLLRGDALAAPSQLEAFSSARVRKDLQPPGRWSPIPVPVSWRFQPA